MTDDATVEALRASLAEALIAAGRHDERLKAAEEKIRLLIGLIFLIFTALGSVVWGQLTGVLFPL